MLSQFDRQVYEAVAELEPDASSYRVWRWVEALNGNPDDLLGICVSIGSLHVSLGRLEQVGFLESEDRPGGPERGYRPRRYYRRTGKRPPEKARKVRLSPQAA